MIVKLTSSLKGPVFYLALAAWFGLLTGFGEVALLAAKKFFLHQFIRFGPHVIWMSPVADALFFMIPGVALSLIAWRWPERLSLRTAVFVLTFLGFISGLLMYSQLHVVAVLLLAVGLAVQTSRMVAARAQAFNTLVRSSLGVILALVLILAGGVHGWQEIIEQRALAELPPAPKNSPNVLLIVLDTVRAQNLSVYGYHRATTPNLERLAAKGVRFERAMSTAPWTLPAHASMFTGRWPNELSANWFTPLDNTHRALAEELKSHGYATAGFVSNTFYCGYETGLSRGFDYYEDFNVSPGELVLSSSLGRTIANSSLIRRITGYQKVLGSKDAAALNAAFLSWLGQEHSKPFFAFINYFDAHEIYLPPEPFKQRFGDESPRNTAPIKYETRRSLRQDWQEMSPQEVQAEIDAYDGAIAYIDHQLGLLFQELERLGVMSNTLVIITSDHGEQFGEHRLFVHGNSLYSQLLHVPLVVSLRGRVPEGTTVSEAVSLRSIPATVLDLIGRKDQLSPFPGTSLSRLWATDDVVNQDTDVPLSELTGGLFGKEWYPGYEGEMKSLVIGQYHYIRNGDGGEELYDLAEDPFEQQDLSQSDERHRNTVGRFRSSLERILASNQTSR